MKREQKRGFSWILTLALMLALVFGMAVAAEATINDASCEKLEISESGDLQLEEGVAYKITITNSYVDLHITGCGAGYDEDGNMTSTPNEVLIDASEVEGTTIRLEDVYISNSFNYANTIDFNGSDNQLIIMGTCVVDTDNNAYGYAAIHVATGDSLTLYGEEGSKLFFYKREQGAGIGGSTGELNGDITFGLENGENNFSVFMKGTKQGALIGAGSNSSSNANLPGSITFNSGVYHLISNSRGAVIGGSAGGKASSGTNVYVNGASLNLNIDYSGSAIGGGGYGGGNDSTGGILTVSSGSIRCYIDANAAGNTSGWMGDLWTAGINDAAITAQRVNTDGEPLYWCIVDLNDIWSGETDENVTVEVDDSVFYHGPMHNTCFIQESLDKGNQYSITSTPSNWLPNSDSRVYLYLTGEQHEIVAYGDNGGTGEMTYNFEPTYDENGAVTGGTFVLDGAEQSYAVAFAGVTTDMTVEVFDAAGDSVGTGKDYSLADGEYTYTVKNNGEQISSGSFTVDGEALSIEILFNITFSVTPANATVEVGANEGMSGYVVKTANPDGSYSLEAGSGYQLTVEAEGYETLKTEFSVDRDAELTYALTYGGVAETAADGSEGEGYYLVDEAVELAWFAQQVNGGFDFDGKTVLLTGDVDLDGAEWTPIGTSANAFAGTFSGANHTVSGLMITDATGGYKGLFGYITGTVENVTVSGSIGTADAYITSGSDNIGGVVGYNDGLVTGVTGSVTVYVNSSNIYAVGGVVGQNGDGAIVENSQNLANVFGTKHAGGVVGRSYGIIRYCSNSGDITGNGGGKDGIGGIVGVAGNKSSTYPNSVLYCYNTGAIGNPGGRWYGGIAGMADSAATVKYCYSVGTLSSGYSWNWNAIIGHVDSAYSTVSNNYSLDSLTNGDTNASTQPVTIGTQLSAEVMQSADFRDMLNALGTYFYKDADGGNNGYPVLFWQTDAQEEQVSGDITGDGDITRLDAAMVYAFVNGSAAFTAEQEAAADVTGDGDVTRLDAAMVYAFVNGSISQFPVDTAE